MNPMTAMMGGQQQAPQDAMPDIEALADDTTELTEEEPPTLNQDSPVELQGDDLLAFRELLWREFDRARSDLQEIKADADDSERRYNLDPLSADELPFADSLPIQVPSPVARTDRVAAELGMTFDRDGSPFYKGVPASPNMLELTGHAEKHLHSIVSKVGYEREVRLAIKRATKVGTSFLVSEVISRPVSSFRGDTDEFDNELQVRSVKVQDMFWAPWNVQDLGECAFVGERFVIARWKFMDMVDAGHFREPINDETGESLPLPVGFTSDEHGQVVEFERTSSSDNSSGSDLPSDMISMIKAWVRYTPQGATRSQLYYVVFPEADPRLIVRLKPNPYDYLDRAPYVHLNVDEGDGTIIGRGFMKILADLAQELNTIHMLRIDALKRVYSNIYAVREGSMLADTLLRRDQEDGLDALGEKRPVDERGTTTATFVPNEVVVTGDVERDMKLLPLAQANPQFEWDEQNIQHYMDEATVNSVPLQSVRSAFEVRQASSEYGAKLKGYLKVITSTALTPLARIMRAQIWQYLMDTVALPGAESIKWLEYGDERQAVLEDDYFEGMDFVPAGTTTSADEVKAITDTAAAITELVPLFINVPGVVPDPAAAIREVVKLRMKALGLEDYESIVGLLPITEEQKQKAILYKQMIYATGGAPTPNGALGGDGGMMGGNPMNNSMMNQSAGKDQTGGSQDGVAPALAKAFGAGSN